MHKAAKFAIHLVWAYCFITSIVVMPNANPILANQTYIPSFPIIYDHEILGIDLDWLSISNGANYVYSCDKYSHECGIWNKITGNFALVLNEGASQADWSIDNSKLVISQIGGDCASSQNQWNTVIFYTQTGIASEVCTPVNVNVADWSPLDNNILLVGGRYLLDTYTMQSTLFSPTTSINPNNFEQYFGYGNKLWDNSSGLPVA